MCGFLGEFLFSPIASNTATVEFEELLALSKHRGPDSSIVQCGENYQLGFNRLAILDLSTNGDQPKYSPSGRYHLVFNGEIYNYNALAEAYDLKNLASTSDTEVLCHLLDKLGIEETIDLLNGMFAIAVVDTKDSSFNLIRDFAGIKPLFYGVSKKGIVTASQFNQVFKHPLFKSDLKLRPSILKEFFGFGYMQAPNTIYKNIFQLKPGELVQWDSKGNMSKRIYKEFKGSSETTDSIKIKNKLSKSLQVSVERQLVSDVPLASFLSGGIDSPLITAHAHENNPSINAYTVSVGDKQMNESNEAIAYAEHLGCNHKVVAMSTDNLLNSIDEHFKLMPEPFGDYSSIPTFNLTKEAKQNYTVMLSGDGGDELYFGYPRMLDVVAHQKWFSIPFTIRRPLYRIIKKLRGLNSWAPYNFKTIEDWLQAKHSYILKQNLDSFFPKIAFSEEMQGLYSRKDTSNLMDYLRFNEFYGHLQRVLIKVDRMSMANSVEVRVPFLDKDNLDLSFSFRPQQFSSTQHLKAPLKDLMRNFYPESIIFKKKKGFTVPMNQWLRNELKNDVDTAVFKTPIYGEELMNVSAIRNYVTDFYKDKHNSEWGVWHIYAWQKWAINQGLISQR